MAVGIPHQIVMRVQDIVKIEMNMQVAHGDAAENGVVTVPNMKEVEMTNEAHLTIEIEQKLSIEIHRRVDLIIAVVALWTDTIAIQLAHELIAPKMTNTVDIVKDPHRTVKIHRLKIVTAQMGATITKNHTIKNRRKSTRKNHQKNTTVQMMIVTSRKKLKKVNVVDLDQDELEPT